MGTPGTTALSHTVTTHPPPWLSSDLKRRKLTRSNSLSTCTTSRVTARSMLSMPVTSSVPAPQPHPEDHHRDWWRPGQGNQVPGFHDFVEILKLYDKNGDDTMIGNELFRLLTNLGEKLTKEEAKALMRSCASRRTRRASWSSNLSWRGCALLRSKRLPVLSYLYCTVLCCTLQYSTVLLYSTKQQWNLAFLPRKVPGVTLPPKLPFAANFCGCQVVLNVRSSQRIYCLQSVIVTGCDSNTRSHSNTHFAITAILVISNKPAIECYLLCPP